MRVAKPRSVRAAAGMLAGVLLGCLLGLAQDVPVGRAEGVVHGFLALRNLAGDKIADGELTQFADGDRVTSRLTFRFRDGSLYDDSTVFSQRGTFRLVSEHMVQKGPSFSRDMDTTISASTGKVKARYMDDGKEKTIDEKIEMPPDLANGMLSVLMKNIRQTPQTLSLLVMTPKPRIVKLAITREGEDPITVAGGVRKTTRYVADVKIGGVAGVVAKVAGKDPSDMRFWILQGDVPAFLKMQGQFFADGPVWIMELSTPSWPPRSG